MRRRAWVGVGLATVVGVAGLLAIPRASSPVDEAVRILALRLSPDDEGWFTFRVNGKPIEIMYRTYILPAESNMSSEALASYLGKKLEPFGWRRKRGTYNHFRGMALLTKGDATIGYSIDPDKPYEHLIEFERRNSFWEGLTARLHP